MRSALISTCSFGKFPYTIPLFVMLLFARLLTYTYNILTIYLKVHVCGINNQFFFVTNHTITVSTCEAY